MEFSLKVLDKLQVYSESWANMELVPYRAYGFRLYRNNSQLQMHVDKSQTHVVSFILHIDSSEDAEPWPIVIEDFHGNTHEVILTSGDLLFYESSKCFHGRPHRFKGSWYSSVFVHYYPKYVSFLDHSCLLSLPIHNIPNICWSMKLLWFRVGKKLIIIWRNTMPFHHTGRTRQLTISKLLCKWWELDWENPRARTIGVKRIILSSGVDREKWDIGLHLLWRKSRLIQNRSSAKTLTKAVDFGQVPMNAKKIQDICWWIAKRVVRPVQQIQQMISKVSCSLLESHP